MRSVSSFTRSSIASTIHAGREHLPVVGDALLRLHLGHRVEAYGDGRDAS